MRFGSTPFRFAARSGPLYGRFAIAWIGTFLLFVALMGVFGYATYLAGADPQFGTSRGQPNPQILWAIVPATVAFYLVFGIIIAWYQAAALNHFAAHTTFAGATFRGNATAWSLIWLVISNLLITSLTLGLLVPVAQARAARYFVERLSIDGAVPVSEIVQRAADPMRRGEGLAQVFDVDAF
jgi:uncharacterized membrane protein YjgN (DUF898 family)